MNEAVFRRRIELTIGPLPENVLASNSDGNAIKIVSDGTQNTLRTRFTVFKQYGATPMPSQIVVSNLGPDLREAIQKTPNVRVVLKVGWDNTELMELLIGSVVSVVSKRNGADIETTIYVYAGFKSISEATCQLSFTSGVAVKDIVYGIALNFQNENPNLKISKDKIQITSATIGSGGYSDTAPASVSLNRLARIYGFSWGIEKDQFWAVSDGNAINSQITIGTSNGFLIRADPMVITAPGQLAEGKTNPAFYIGMTILSILHPLIEAAGLVYLDSAINPKLNDPKGFIVNFVTHTGDSHGEEWYSEIQSYNYGNLASGNF